MSKYKLEENNLLNSMFHNLDTTLVYIYKSNFEFVAYFIDSLFLVKNLSN